MNGADWSNNITPGTAVAAYDNGGNLYDTWRVVMDFYDGNGNYVGWQDLCRYGKEWACSNYDKNYGIYFYGQSNYQSNFIVPNIYVPQSYTANDGSVLYPYAQVSIRDSTDYELASGSFYMFTAAPAVFGANGDGGGDVDKYGTAHNDGPAVGTAYVFPRRGGFFSQELYQYDRYLGVYTRNPIQASPGDDVLLTIYTTGAEARSYYNGYDGTCKTGNQPPVVTFDDTTTDYYGSAYGGGYYSDSKHTGFFPYIGWQQINVDITDGLANYRFNTYSKTTRVTVQIPGCDGYYWSNDGFKTAISFY